jgi:nicotinate-nucleotide pyrophosphorylase (carboxylating)
MFQGFPMSERTVAALRREGLDPDAVRALVVTALDEDLMGGEDVTSSATIAADHRSRATFTARADGVIAGIDIVGCVLDTVCGPAARFEILVEDGSPVTAGDRLAIATAPTRRLLTAERTALNLLCHLSGVATLTRRWADALHGTRAVVRDTRKTTPGLRRLEKYAVRCGGGANHRMGLFDMALVKDNHVAAAGGVAEAFARVRSLSDVPVEIEVDDLDDLRIAIEAGADEVLIDNFSTAQMRAAVALRDAIGPRVRLEASGGLTLESAAAVAATGVDYIAVGELTHSAPVLDIGLDLVAAV